MTRSTLQSNNPLPPLMKWTGGKRFLVSKLLELTPETFGRYYEPFLGGGAFFFALRPARATLSDVNEELIATYKAIQADPESVIRSLKRWGGDEKSYYEIRELSPQSESVKAARILYLTSFSFNGIYRVNKKGVFNVPYGYKTSASWTDSRIRETSLALAKKKIVSLDFERATNAARSGDFIYFDPPYTVAHSNNGFVKYNSQIFSWADQQRLAKHAEVLRLRGCHVAVSNADHASIKELYPAFNCEVVERFSVMAASSQHRKKIRELVFYSRAKDHAN